MQQSPEMDRLLAANRSFASDFQDGGLPAPPALGLAVVTCMDARMDPQRFLGLRPGDAHVIRNAGGRTTEDALRSLVVSSLLLGTHDVIVIHHTKCGMLTHSNEDIRREVRERTGTDADHIDFLPFTDLEESVREDVALVKDSGLLPDYVNVRGFIYDVETGRLSPVGQDAGPGVSEQ